MKSYSKFLLLGFLGGILGTYFFISMGGGYMSNILFASDFGPQLQAPPDVSPSPSPAVSSWQKIISDSSPRSVAVNVFKNDKLVRQGSGVVVSSDGLVVTVGDLAISGAVYQVFYGDKITKGVVASLDYSKNLLLLKTDSASPNVDDLKEINYMTGDELIILGRTVNLSEAVVFSRRGLVSSVTDKLTVIDTTYSVDLSGTAAININGELLGLSYLRNGKVNLVPSVAIADFLQKYLDKNNS